MEKEITLLAMLLVQFSLETNGVSSFLRLINMSLELLIIIFFNIGNNVWLRERGQEFKRPCDLQPDHEPDDVWISLLGQ